MPATGAPLGTPFGVGIPANATEPAQATALSRYIDPNNGTYQIDPDTGVYATMPVTRQRVMLALITELGSSTALPELGIVRPRKLGPRTEREVQDSVRRALRTMTEIEGVVRVDAVTLERTGPGRGTITVRYTDLTTGDPDTVRV